MERMKSYYVYFFEALHLMYHRHFSIQMQIYVVIFNAFMGITI